MFNKTLSSAKKMDMGSPAISRNSLVWLFIIQILILTPHFFNAPIWISIMWLGVVFWRWKIFQGAWNYPNKLHKTFVVLLCIVGLIVSLGLNFSLITMVSLLLVGFILKLLEMKTRKDFVLLVYIAFFILAAQFIFFNNFLAAFYGFLCSALLCASLMQLYANSAEHKKITVNILLSTMRSSLVMLLQAIPFMIILFVVIPRLGSFWAVPSAQHAKTGMSDSMSPGDISELIQSDELAFRVIFTNRIPANDQLYWRNLVFSQFDGRRWSLHPQSLVQQDFQTSSQQMLVRREKIEYLGEKTMYEIIAEPTGKPWLYVLAAPEAWSGDLVLGRDLHLQATKPIIQRINYTVTSALSYRLDVSPQHSEVLQQNLQLPNNVNPETRRLAREWFVETGNTEKLIEKLFNYYHNSFFYTLRPPSLRGDTVDEFLWQSRQGFCEHFSSSFVFFMRAAGVPARVVVGYQGGEIHPTENYVTVRQRDAHAWAEVWIQDRGWVLFDPTAAVAPERIRSGIAASLSATDQEVLHRHFGSSLQLLVTMRNQWEGLNFQWTRWVMNYDSGLQSALLSKLLSDISPWRIVLVILGAAVLTTLLIFVILFFRSYYNPLSAQERAARAIYQQLCQKLSRCGVVPTLGETPRHLVMRAIQLQPHLASTLTTIINLYEQLIYAENVSVSLELKRELAKISVKSKAK